MPTPCDSIHAGFVGRLSDGRGFGRCIKCDEPMLGTATQVPIEPGVVTEPVVREWTDEDGNPQQEVTYRDRDRTVWVWRHAEITETPEGS